MSKEMKRARRRQDRARMLARAKRYYPGQRHQRLADNLASCSCWMCGNPRRWHGEVTMQERRQDVRDRDSE
ncbi:hypothetical protein [Azospirillum agricola]|uniref:hypothetical protein n=1 Tax=Azospirillum agricola TaxID=1720247 RepID=UPI000A1C8C12|nr:hypothetical protein [Azospirillum agricola]